MILDWLRSLRQQQPATAADIRRQLTALHQQRAVTVQQRDLVALDAVNDEPSAARWVHLDATARDLDSRIAVLATALPQAEAREAEAARQAEADAYAKRMERYRQQTAEAQAWLDAVLARLPTGEELTQARNLRAALHAEAVRLEARGSREVAVRRPCDPLDAIYAALAMRVQRIERARWIHGDHPITLLDETPKAS